MVVNYKQLWIHKQRPVCLPCAVHKPYCSGPAYCTHYSHMLAVDRLTWPGKSHRHQQQCFWWSACHQFEPTSSKDYTLSQMISYMLLKAFNHYKVKSAQQFLLSPNKLCNCRLQVHKHTLGIEQQGSDLILNSKLQ